jgi:hypothetical protein
MGRAIFLKKGLFMRENFLKPRRFALSGVSSFLSGGSHLSLIPPASPPTRTPRGTRSPERHPPYLLSLIYYLNRTDTSPALTCQAVIASPVGAKQSSHEASPALDCHAGARNDDPTADSQFPLASHQLSWPFAILLLDSFFTLC